MTEIVNLNKARKQRAKRAGLKKAAENNVKFGMPRRERALARDANEKQGRKFDGLRLPSDPDQGD
ncbi:MAG: DUF4169 family protein [Pseudomonadota bacterium]